MNSTTRKLFVAAAVAGMISAGSVITSTVAHADDEKGKCTEHNKCKGKSSCAGTAAGKEHSCKGQNECKGNVRADMSEKDCKKMHGKFEKNA